MNVEITEDIETPKHFRKFLNRSQRAKSKQTLFNIMDGKRL